MAFDSQPWTPESWQQLPVLQQVRYPDPDELRSVLARIASWPPLVTSFEVDTLRRRLAEAANGRSFLLQGGDCAERFEDCQEEIIKNRLKILLQMSVVLIYGLKMPVVRVGRFAGQFAKPRSAPTETRNGVTLPSFRGDNINGSAFTAEARRPDPARLILAYRCSAVILNLVRALGEGGFANLHNLHYWNLGFAERSPHYEEYRNIIRRVRDALTFAETVAHQPIGGLRRVRFFTCHEALHLPYEQALTRTSKYRDGVYNLSTHLPWIGKRTLELGTAHVEYMRGIRNPIGIKVGPHLSPRELTSLVRHLNPEGVYGRLTLITRFGVSKVEQALPPLVRAVRDGGHKVLWCCDPMHGNTQQTNDGIKTRHFDSILAEVKLVNRVLAAEGARLGGVHLELAGEDVTECIGGASGLEESDLRRAYLTTVDPRLNAEQALEVALRIVGMLDLMPRN